MLPQIIASIIKGAYIFSSLKKKISNLQGSSAIINLLKNYYYGYFFELGKNIPMVAIYSSEAILKKIMEPMVSFIALFMTEEIFDCLASYFVALLEEIINWIVSKKTISRDIEVYQLNLLRI